jgi:hypothetical protein
VPEVFELEIFPISESDAGGLASDALEVGTPPREWAWSIPNWLDPLLSRVPTRFVLALLGVGLVVAVTISVTHPSATRAAPAPAPAPIVSPVALSDPDLLALSAMVSVAHSTDQLHDFEIVDNVHPNCPAALAQPDPAAAIATTVVRYQPGFQLRDTGLGSELTGVCSAQLRFIDDDGDTMVVSVIAPPNALTPFTVTSATPDVDAIDVVVIVDSWRIEIGMVGPPGTMLDEQQLVAIATDARLRWS